jgi:hypothetical protein
MHLFQVFAGSDTSLDSALTALDKVTNAAFTNVGPLRIACRSVI